MVLASQHAITTFIAPPASPLPIARLDFRLRSANREECYALVMTRQADIVLLYATERHPLAMESSFVESRTLARKA